MDRPRSPASVELAAPTRMPTPSPSSCAWRSAPTASTRNWTTDSTRSSWQALAGRGVISDLDKAKTILLWGPDLKEELGSLYLRVRHAAQELGATLIVVHPRGTGLDDRATHKFTYRPGDGPNVLKKLAAGLEDYAQARTALNEGPVVAIVGRTGYTEDPRLAESVAAFARDLPDATVLPIARRGNVFGALDMGLAPSLLPGRVSVRSDEGRVRPG